MGQANGTSNSSVVNLRSWAAEAEAAAGIARALAPTPFVPEQLRRYENPEVRDPAKKILDLEGTIATVAAVLLAGQELDMGPMAALRSITIIKGTVALYALAARALLQRRGHEITLVESTSMRAIVRGRRSPDGEWQQSVWDLDRAKTARLYPGHPDGNWRTQTKSMLVARATAEASRLVAADALLGLPVIAEEIADGELPAALEESEPPGDGSAVPEPAPGPAADKAAPKTAKRSRQPARAALPSAPPMPPPPPPVSREPEPPSQRPRMTPNMANRLHGALRALGIMQRAEGLGMIAAWIGRPVESTAELTPDEGGIVIERLDAIRSVARQPDHQPPPDQPGQPPPDEPPPDQPGQPDQPDQRKEAPPDAEPERE